MASRPPSGTSTHGIRIDALGGLRVTVAGTEVAELPSQPVRCALLVYLAVEGRATRDELVALCWPDRSTDRARHSLSQALYELRRQLGDGWCTTAGEQVSAAVHSDVAAFEAAVGTGRDEEATSLYRGPFLDGVHLAASQPFESWVTRRRTQLARGYRTACRRLCDELLRAGDEARALAVAQEWTHHEPLDDEAHHRVIELLAATGRRTEALHCYDEYAERIARELDVRPLDETQQLAATIRAAASVTSPAPLPPAAGPQRQEHARDSGRVTTAPSAAEHATHATHGFAEPRPPSRRVRKVLTAAALLVALSGVAYVGTRTAARAPAPADDAAARGLVVLPFANLGADPEQEYFVDGVAEDLLTILSRLEGLRVISRTSAWRYKGSDLAAGDIGRELGVAWILEGSVRREGDHVRITAQLIDAVSDAHVWAESYDRELTGIFELQREIAERIARELALRIAPDPRNARVRGADAALALPASSSTDREQLAAYDLLLRGLAYLHRPGAGDVRKFEPAAHYFREALRIAPGYARAHVGLGEAFRTNVALPLPVRRDSAYLHARRAVELDSALADGRALLGWTYLIRREPDRAESEFRRAVAMDANHVRALSGMARLAWIRGGIDDAVRWQRRAVAVDPWAAGELSWLGGYYMDLGDASGAEDAYARAAALAPDAPSPAYMLAQLALLRGDSAAADAFMDRLAEEAAGHPGAEFLLGRYYAQRGRFAAAAPLLDRAADRLAGAVATTSLQRAWLAARSGRAAEAATLLELAARDLDDAHANGFHAPRLQIQLAALRGDAPAAVATLRRWWRFETGGDLAAGPQIGLYWIDADPLLENLRTDPAFQALLAEIRRELDTKRSRLEGTDLRG